VRQLLNRISDKWVTLSLMPLISCINEWAETHMDDVAVARESYDSVAAQ
jgi:hypothetical protein